MKQDLRRLRALLDELDPRAIIDHTKSRHIRIRLSNGATVIASGTISDGRRDANIRADIRRMLARGTVRA